MRQEGFSKVFNRILIIAIFILITVMSLRRMSDTDLWGHLECGEYLFKTGSILKIHLFNSTWHDFPYLNHEWLFQGIIYGIYLIGGEWSLLFFQVLLIIGAFYFLYKILKLNLDDRFAISIVLFLGALSSGHRFALRPQHLTFIFMLYYIWSLMRYQRGDTRYAWFMPLLMIPWVNIHAESLWGLVIPGVFIIVETYKYIMNKGIEKRRLKNLYIIFILILFASLINPFTYRTVIHPFIVMYEQFAGVEEILMPLGKRYIFFYIYFVLFLFTVVFYRRALDPSWLILSLVFSIVAWTANRGIPHFVFLSSVIVAKGIEVFFYHYKERFSRIMNPLKVSLLIYVIYLLISILTSPLFFKKYNNYPYPENALIFMKKNGITGNVFNHHPWGGFIIWNTYPDLRPFIDGRFFHKRFYDEFYHVLHVKPGWQDILTKYNINIILLPYSREDSGSLADRLFHSINWRLVYWDDQSLLYLRDIHEFKSIIEEYSNIYVNPDRNLYDWNESNMEIIEKVKRIADKNIDASNRSYRSLILSGNAYFLSGDYDTAGKRYIEALNYRQNAWLYYRIALSYRRMGDIKNTLHYIRKAYELAPDSIEVSRLLREVEILNAAD